MCYPLDFIHYTVAWDVLIVLSHTLLCFSVIHLIDNLLLFNESSRPPPPLILAELTLMEHVWTQQPEYCHFAIQ